MATNAENVARHKIFRGEPGFPKKKNKDSVTYPEIQEIMDKAVPETTKKPQRSR